jgi:pyridoxine 5-phosphate synthase
MTRLSVNINKLATLRNARGGNNPDVVKMALACESYGAQGITVHPRPDERHIRYADVVALAPVLTTEFNIEGYPDARYFELIQLAKPAQATLVPDPPGVLTSNAGWDTIKHKDFLTDVVAELHALGTRVSVFVGTDLALIEGAAAIGADRIELYTEPYAANYFKNKVEIYSYLVLSTRNEKNPKLSPKKTIVS